MDKTSDHRLRFCGLAETRPATTPIWTKLRPRGLITTKVATKLKWTRWSAILIGTRLATT